MTPTNSSQIVKISTVIMMINVCLCGYVCVYVYMDKYCTILSNCIVEYGFYHYGCETFTCD